MPLSLGRASFLRLSSRRAQWICHECSKLLKQKHCPSLSLVAQERPFHRLRPTIADPTRRPTSNRSRLLLSGQKNRHASVEASPALPDEAFRGTHMLSPGQGKNAGERPPLGELEATQKAGKTSMIRSKLRAWQEDFVRETSPGYIDQALGGDVSRIWQRTRPVLDFDRGDGLLANDTGPANEQDRNFDPDEDVEYHGETVGKGLEYWNDNVIVRPGDLIDRQRSHPNELAVVVQTDGADLIVYNLAGRWSRWERFQNRDIQFHLPQFIGQDFVDAVLPFVSETIDKDGVSEPPPGFLEGAVPRHLGGPALDKLHAHNREVQMFHASHAKKLDYVWELLAQDDKRVNLSMSDASIMLFNQPSSDLTAPALHALNQALYDDYMNIATNVGGRTTGKTFSLRSKHESEMQQRVLKWARNYQDAAAKAARGWAVQHTLKENPLNKFILKARRAILKSRSYRSPTVMGTAGPSAPMVADPTKITVEDDANFSDADRDIIKFVMNAHGTVPSRSLLVKSTASMILRAIGAYPNMPLGVPTGRLLLQEIGVHAPWDYLRLHDPMLKVPGNGSLPSLDLTLAKTRKLAMDDPHECNKDMNAGFRKDWVDMVAFRVDALSTKDHDDAFSLEQEPGRENAWWIHVHIADPAAFIPPDHPFAKYAAEVRATTYLVEQTSGMLPPELIARLAVASNRPVLTFSSLVQSDGETLDFKITPGTVRNIISCTPGTLSRFLFGQRPEPIRFSVRSNNANAVAPREGGARHLEPHRQTLRKLAELAKAMQRRREAKWRPRTWEGGRYACQAYISPIPRTKVDRDPTHSRIFQGDPSISLEMMPANHPDHDLDIVGEIMTGANIAVARWCRERGVSIPYLATEYHPNFPRERLRSLQRHEYTVFPATKKTTEPRPHDLVPADQYTQATSPLRRFHDLSVHWQIRGVLKHEHKHGRSLRYTENLQSALPFSKTDIERSIDEYEFFEKLKARMGNKNINHWAIQALFRAVHFKEGQLPDITYLRVQNKTKSDAINGVGWIGNLAPFDVQAVLGTSTEGFEKGVEAHDVIPCKISRVETAMQICLVVAVGPALNSNVFDDISVMNPLKFTQEEYNRLLLGYGKGQS